jgi:hypothetical protein
MQREVVTLSFQYTTFAPIPDHIHPQTVFCIASCPFTHVCLHTSCHSFRVVAIPSALPFSHITPLWVTNTLPPIPFTAQSRIAAAYITSLIIMLRMAGLRISPRALDGFRSCLDMLEGIVVAIERTQYGGVRRSWCVWKKKFFFTGKVIEGR